jgi:hypothetical protein
MPLQPRLFVQLVWSYTFPSLRVIDWQPTDIDLKPRSAMEATSPFFTPFLYCDGVINE